MTTLQCVPGYHSLPALANHIPSGKPHIQAQSLFIAHNAPLFTRRGGWKNPFATLNGRSNICRSFRQFAGLVSGEQALANHGSWPTAISKSLESCRVTAVSPDRFLMIHCAWFPWLSDSWISISCFRFRLSWRSSELITPWITWTLVPKFWLQTGPKPVLLPLLCAFECSRR